MRSRAPARVRLPRVRPDLLSAGQHARPHEAATRLQAAAAGDQRRLREVRWGGSGRRVAESAGVGGARGEAVWRAV